MRYTPIRNISEDEKRELYDVLDDGIDIKYRAKIVLLAEEGHISSISPREIGLKFSTWSLRSIAGYVKEKKLIKDGISHTAIRDILIEYGVEWRHSKTVLGKSKNPDYDLKKAY